MSTKKIKMTRRDFVKGAVLTGAAVAVSSNLKPALRAFAASTESPFTESGKWKPTTCQGCTSWCSV